MPNYTRITPENVLNYPVGTELEFKMGAYYAPAYGKVIGYKIIEENEYFPESARLIAEYFDPNDEKVYQTEVSMFTDIGIGVYLLSVPEAKKNEKSPWVR